jgi:hypothetical protein
VPRPAGLLRRAAQLRGTSCAPKVCSPRDLGAVSGERSPVAELRRGEWREHQRVTDDPSGKKLGAGTYPRSGMTWRWSFGSTRQRTSAAGALRRSSMAAVGSYTSRRSKRLRGARRFEEKGVQNGAHHEGDKMWWRRRFDLAPTDNFGQEDKGAWSGLRVVLRKGRKRQEGKLNEGRRR